MAKLNPMSIASRSRRSVSLIERTPPIPERYKYPHSIVSALRSKLTQEFQQRQNEILQKEQKYLQIQRSKSFILSQYSSKSLQAKPTRPQQTHEQRYSKYLKNSSKTSSASAASHSLEQKYNDELLKYYTVLSQHINTGRHATLVILPTNLERIFLKFFVFNKIKKEILILNTPHQYAHYVTADQRLYKSTLLILRLLRELIEGEECIAEERKRGVWMGKKIKCEIFRQEEDGECEEEVERRDEEGRLIEPHGIGREGEYEKEKKIVEEMLMNRDKVMTRYGTSENYKGILSPYPGPPVIDPIFLDRDPPTQPQGGGLYDLYLDYRSRYLSCHQRYCHLTNLIVIELEDCFTLCQTLSISTHLSPSSSSVHPLESFSLPSSLLLSIPYDNSLSSSMTLEDICLHRLTCLEMIFHEISSLQDQLMTRLQIIHSILLAIEISFYENIFQFSQIPSHTLPLTLSSDSLERQTISPINHTPYDRKGKRKDSYVYTNSENNLLLSRVYNPSCPISATYMIRCLYPTYSLSAIYLGYHFLVQEIEGRFNDSLPESKAKSSRPNSRQGQQQQKDADLISYKSLLPLEEELSVDSDQSSSKRSTSVSKKKKIFNPTKGRKMKFPTPKQVTDEPPQKEDGEKVCEESDGEEESMTSLTTPPIEQYEKELTTSLPPILSGRSHQSSSAHPTARESIPLQQQDSEVAIKNDSSMILLPPILLPSRATNSCDENDKDDVSALTTPGGYQSDRISSRKRGSRGGHSSRS
jgi:hypothetical protein